MTDARRHRLPDGQYVDLAAVTVIRVCGPTNIGGRSTVEIVEREGESRRTIVVRCDNTDAAILLQGQLSDLVL